MDKTNKINNIFTILSKDNPSPNTELNYCSNFTLLVAIVLSAQSTDVGVNKATKILFQKVQTPQEMINLGIDKLKDHIRSLGLYNSKAKNIMALAKILLEDYQGEVPTSLEQLENLPGVGGKTARVFLNCAYKAPLIAVDTHVFRVSRRLGIVKSDKIKLVEKELNEIVPSKWKVHAHHWLILHGRYICKARKPNCLECPIKEYCNFYLGEKSVD